MSDLPELHGMTGNVTPDGRDVTVKVHLQNGQELAFKMDPDDLHGWILMFTDLLGQATQARVKANLAAPVGSKENALAPTGSRSMTQALKVEPLADGGIHLDVVTTERHRLLLAFDRQQTDHLATVIALRRRSLQ